MRLHHGFAYIALLATLAILMLALTSASESISHNAKREREQQLFFVGEQFRNAIKNYYENSPSGVKQFPNKLNDLLKDNRFAKPARYLRRIYRDPMSNDFDWGVVLNENKQIVGIYSLSSKELLKTNLPSDLVTVDSDKGKLKYSDLKFIYTPEPL